MLQLRRRLAARGTYKQRVLQIRALIRNKGLGIAKTEKGYHLQGDEADKHLLHELLKNAEALAELLRPKTLNKASRAWQKAFWGTDFTRGLDLPTGEKYTISNGCQNGKGIHLGQGLYFFIRRTLGTGDVWGYLAISTTGEEPTEEHWSPHQEVVLRKDLLQHQVLLLWHETTGETNPRRDEEEMFYYAPQYYQGGTCGEKGH